MNELDRALQIYMTDHPEHSRSNVTLTDLLFFLVHKVEALQSQLKSTGRRKPKRTLKRSQETINRAFAWAGMKEPRVAEPANNEVNVSEEG